jgi:uncharacterized membrane protein YtjA (UPF0391 family)
MSVCAYASSGRNPASRKVRYGNDALRRHRLSVSTKVERSMLHYAVIFFVIALIAAVFGFAGIAAGAAGIAKILFFVFLILAIVSFIANTARR